ncbi:MAG: porin [Marinibacterium sp.]|nr:porin [Marinibacterium sp.]
MKKILCATTALIATAGVASADIANFNLSGYGRFGLRYDEGNDKKTFLESRLRINIDAATETDGGVRFSARVRAQADDDADNTAGTAGFNAARFSAEYEGLRIDVGNAAGAIDNLPNYYGFEPGLSNFVGQYSGVDFDFSGYSSTGGENQNLYARYAFSDFAVAGSYNDANDKTWDLHFAYEGDTYGAAIAYGANDSDDDIIVATGSATFGAFTGVLFLGTETLDQNKDAEGFFYGVSAGYDITDATEINFSYGDGNGDDDTQQYGVGVIHQLGGGVSIRGGIGATKEGDGDTDTLGDIGVRFNF